MRTEYSNIILITNVSRNLHTVFIIALLFVDIGASLARTADNCYTSLYLYVVDFREGIIIGNFLWRICAQYPIPFSLVLFLFSNPNERTCLVCIAISIYWLSSVRSPRIPCFLFGYSFDIKT